MEIALQQFAAYIWKKGRNNTNSKLKILIWGMYISPCIICLIASFSKYNDHPYTTLSTIPGRTRNG